MVDNLPDQLVQPKTNYRLIFAEEFNGTGISSLDSSTWHYSNNEPCETIENGYYRMARTLRCSSDINTRGKFSYTYGYLEVRYTIPLVDLTDWTGNESYHNMAFFAGEDQRHAGYQHPHYGISIDTLEDYGRYFEMELDIFEIEGHSRRRNQISHQYLNWHRHVDDSDIVSTRSTKSLALCQGNATNVFDWGLFPEANCTRVSGVVTHVGGSPDLTSVQEITFVKGFEWTPRGYRTFFKLEDLNPFGLADSDAFTIWPKEKINVQYLDSDGRKDYEGAAREEFFELLDENDADSFLEQVGIAHMPVQVELLAWGKLTQEAHRTMRTQVKVDYIRIFQPENHYADMDPVYQ